MWPVKFIREIYLVGIEALGGARVLKINPIGLIAKIDPKRVLLVMQ